MIPLNGIKPEYIDLANLIFETLQKNIILSYYTKVDPEHAQLVFLHPQFAKLFHSH